MTKDEIDAVVEAAFAPLYKPLAEIASAVQRMEERERARGTADLNGVIARAERDPNFKAAVIDLLVDDVPGWPRSGH
jgi:hypothetical protein